MTKLIRVAEDYFHTLDIEPGSYSSVDLGRMDIAKCYEQANITVTVGTFSCKFAQCMAFELVNKFESICGISGSKRHKFIKLAADGTVSESVNVNKMKREHVKTKRYDIECDIIRRHSYENIGLAYDVSDSRYITIQHKPSGRKLWEFNNPLRRILDVIKFCEKSLSAFDWTSDTFPASELEKRHNKVYARYSA